MHPTIFERTFRPQRDIHLEFSHVVLVESGAGRVFCNDEEFSLSDGAIYFMPPGRAIDISMSAGTNCYLLGISPDLLVDAIGNKAESVLLRIFSERPAMLPRIADDLTAELASHCMGFIKELERADGGSWMALSAFARLVLIEIWRGKDVAEPDKRLGEVHRILQSFRQMVEVNFRSQMTIPQYAFELGMTHSRLHAVCQRSLSRTPLQLLHQRRLHEAKLRLERSGDTVQEIANQLGFDDATNFSHFFKKNIGLPPGAYRKLVRESQGVEKAPLVQAFADWP